jgi:2Fe-2S ferredoxin
MPKIQILPHHELCPEGATFEVACGDNLLEEALKANVYIEHACEMSCACTTCHVILREGYSSVEASDESEDDLLDRAWGLTPTSRLSCQVFVGNEDLVVELPQYTLNHASEKR